MNGDFERALAQQGLTPHDLKNAHLARAVAAWTSAVVGIFFAAGVLLNPSTIPHSVFALAMVGCSAVALASAFVQSFRCLQLRSRSLALTPSDWCKLPRDWFPPLRWRP